MAQFADPNHCSDGHYHLPIKLENDIRNQRGICISYHERCIVLYNCYCYDKLHKIPLMYGSVGGLIREGEYSSRTCRV